MRTVVGAHVHICRGQQACCKAGTARTTFLAVLLCSVLAICPCLFWFGFAQEARLCFGGTADDRAGIFVLCRVQRPLALIWSEHPSSDQARLLLRPFLPLPNSFFLVLCCCQQNPNTAVNIVHRIHISFLKKGKQVKLRCVVRLLGISPHCPASDCSTRLGLVPG